MRIIALCLALLCGCVAPSSVPPPQVPRRQVLVALVNCREPFREWAADQLKTLASLGVDWVLVQSAAQATVEVRCRDTAPRSDWLGWYTIRDRFVSVDTDRTPSEFQFRTVFGHELVHWFIGTYAPHSERGLMHVCNFAWNDSAPDRCHPTIVAVNALMSPTPIQDLSDDDEAEFPPRIAQYELTRYDLEFFSWAMGN